MPQLTFNRRRINKAGWVSYKASAKRSAGTVYLNPRCYEGDPPETLVIEGENLIVPAVEAPTPAPAPSDQPVEPTVQ